MKKQIAVACVLTLGAAAAAFGARGDGVPGSPHDLTVQAGYAGNETQGRICAYCHTPHHAATANARAEYLPLWSKDVSQDTADFFNVYNSSTINAAELSTTSDKAIGPTRLCMSCHDGSVAPDQHYGSTGGTGTLLTNDSWGGAGVGNGSGLTNDHPVGFDYPAVAAGPATGAPSATDVSNATATQDPWIRNPSALYLDNAFTLTVGDRLYHANDGKAYMTCATCHDVHNRKNTYTSAEAAGVTANYLVLAPQNGSKLCLSCHIK